MEHAALSVRLADGSGAVALCSPAALARALAQGAASADPAPLASALPGLAAALPRESLSARLRALPGPGAPAWLELRGESAAGRGAAEAAADCADWLSLFCADGEALSAPMLCEGADLDGDCALAAVVLAEAGALACGELPAPAP